MLAVISFILFTSAFAETLPALDCSLAELSQRCFTSVCNSTRRENIPTTTDELSRAITAMNYRMPDANSVDADRFVEALVNLNRRSTALVETRGFDGIADDVLNHLDQNMAALHAFFRSELPVTYENGEVTVVRSDVGGSDPERTERLAGFLKSYFEMYMGVTKAQERLRMPRARQFFMGFLTDVEKYFQRVNPARASAIASARPSLATRSDQEIASLAFSGLSQDDVRGIFAQKFLPVKNDLTSYLSDRADASKTRVTKGLQPKPIRDSITRSCQLAQFMAGKMNSANPQAQFETAKQNAIRGMYSGFLMKLSEHSRGLIQTALQANPFSPIQFDRNIYPDFPALTLGITPFADQMSPTAYLMQSQVFEHSEEFVCSLESFIPKDEFNGTEIHTSLFTIATGHPDILAHELGHWVSQQMSSPEMSSTSRAKFTNVRQCLTGFYQNEFRTEEDFADWFQNSTVPSTGIGCTLDTMVPLLWNFMVGDTSTETRDPYAPDPADNHSNALFREIHGKMVRGEELSLACRQLVNQYPQAQPRRCEL